MVRVFAYVPGDPDSIPDLVIPKTQKMVLDASLHYIQLYKVGIKGKCSNSGKGVPTLPTHRWSSCRKESLYVALP